jgi:hypothetical protein
MLSSPFQAITRTREHKRPVCLEEAPQPLIGRMVFDRAAAIRTMARATNHRERLKDPMIGLQNTPPVSRTRRPHGGAPGTRLLKRWFWKAADR